MGSSVRQAAVTAYRRYLSLEHRRKLAERASVTDSAALGELPQAVGRLWDETFN